jgi:calcineurin-like phosphoesterase family protein
VYHKCGTTRKDGIIMGHGNYIISDLHFCHENIIEFTGRPFKDASHMDYELIKRWNEVVNNKDTIYILGDFAFANKEKINELVSMLNGRKVLIMGNHDRKLDKHVKFWYDCGFDEVYRYPIIFKKFFILSHEPVKHVGVRYNIHGHKHNNKIDDNHYINVSVEHTDYRPVNLDKLIAKVYKSRTYRSEIMGIEEEE